MITDKQNKMIIVGADGFIGSSLIEFIKKKEPTLHYVPYVGNSNQNYNCFDLRNVDPEIFTGISKNDFVVFLAAVSSPDLCHNNYDFAYSINVTGTSRFIEKCLNKGAKVLFFSSDVVFGKSKDTNDELSNVAPFGEYAEMKVEIENRFKSHPNFKVFRLSYVFSKYDKFTKYLRNCMMNKKVAEVYDGLYRNVIYLDDILEAICNLQSKFDQFDNTFFHMSGREVLSRSDIAILVHEHDKSLKYNLIPVPDGFYDARAERIIMNSIFSEKLLGRSFSDIRNAIKKEFETEGEIL